MAALQDLAALIDRYCIGARSETGIPRLGLIRATTVTLPVQTIYEPRLIVVAQGRKQGLLGEQVFDYGAGSYVVVSVDLPVSAAIREASVERPYLALSLRFESALLADVLLGLPPAAMATHASPGLAVSLMTDGLLDPLVRLVRLLEQSRDIPMLAPLVEREILYRLLLGEHGAMLRQIALADSRMSQIGRTITWIRRNYDQPLRIDALAAMASMSASSFHRHFKAVTALSPLQYQKQIRLREARRLLLANDGDAARIGFAVGYESASQFSREYSRQFGAPPARDAAQLRTLAASDPAHLAGLVEEAG